MGSYGIYTSFLIYDENAVLSLARAPEAGEQLAALIENLIALDDTQRESFQDSLLYRLDTPVYIRYGNPLLVSHMGAIIPDQSFAHDLASPFVHYDTGVLYLPLGNLLTDTMYYSWDEEENLLTIGILPVTEGFLFYRSHIFLSEQLITHLFAYRILRVEDFILVGPMDMQWLPADLLTLGQVVFYGV